MVADGLALGGNKQPIDLVHDEVTEILDGPGALEGGEVGPEGSHDSVKTVVVGLQVGHLVNEALFKFSL